MSFARRLAPDFSLGRAASALGLCAFLTACLPTEPPTEQFFENMTLLCERTVEGRVVSDQAVDADWIGQPLVVGPVSCEDSVIRMPLAVGDDASRVWVLSRISEDLEFRHEHVEPDGSPSPVTQYGGYSDSQSGTALQQSFPADEATKANFTENGIARSNTNVWTFRISADGKALTYQLARPATQTDEARDFRAEFDL